MNAMLATDEILAATAHELRLPLSHIKGFVTSLRRTDVEWDDATQKEFITEIDLETDRLTEVVEALLATHTADGRNEPDATRGCTHPAAVVQGALQRVRGVLDGRPMQLDVSPCLPVIQMHASQMERLLANLLDNAVKYSPAGTPIGVSARITGFAELELAVEDEGPGVPPADRERIFEPFFRMRVAEQSEVSGHGLGLAICKSIALTHGGRIQVSERPGGGARFSVFLPATGQCP